MAITPADIQAQTFSEAKRGYDPAEVDVFLETLSSEVDAMLAKIVDLKGRLTATEQQLADTQAQLAQARMLPPRPFPLPRLPPLRRISPLRSVRFPLPLSLPSRPPRASSTTPTRMPTVFATRLTPRLARSSVRL